MPENCEIIISQKKNALHNSSVHISGMFEKADIGSEKRFASMNKIAGKYDFLGKERTVFKAWTEKILISA